MTLAQLKLYSETSPMHFLGRFMRASYVKPVLHLLHNLLKPDDEESELTVQIKTIDKYLSEN